jgi:uncharacterized membrane protein YccC
MADAPTTESRQAAVALALRSATAMVFCLLVSGWLHLEEGFLSVFTAHVVNILYSQTPFQKGVERVVGRLLGVFGCTLLFALFRQTPALCLALAVVVLMVLFYVQSAGWFAYGVLMAAVFSMNTVATGLTQPYGAVVHTLWPTVVQLLLGVFAAEAVNFLAGAERTVQLVPGGSPMLPLRGAWISRAARLTLTAFAAVFLAYSFGLPVNTTAVAAVILSTTADIQTMELKGALRIAAVVIGSLYCVGVLLLLSQVPSFGLLALLLFFGMFLGTYSAHVHTKYSYLGLQLGIVLGQVLVVPPDEVIDLKKAFLRLVGSLTGFAVAFVLQELWPTAPAVKPGS